MKTCLVACLILLFAVGLNPQSAKLQIAVLDLEPVNINTSESLLLTDRLRSELLNLGAFTILERNKMEDILEEQGFQQTGCTSTECVVEAGKLLNVNRICAGSIGKVGATYTINLRMIDVETGEIRMSVTEDCRQCPIDEVLTVSMKQIALKLADRGRSDTPSRTTPVQDRKTYTSFTSSPVTDIDGNVYNTVKIGDQVWMAENLKVTHYRNGEAIAHVTDNTQWTTLSSGAWCSYNNDDNNADTYGLLYNWYAAADSRNIAPEGWHVPTDAEWQTLVDYLGGGPVAGGKLKEAGLDHWISPNTDASNESGFSALPGGCRSDYNGRFLDMGSRAYFWSSTEGGAYGAWNRVLYYGDSRVGWANGNTRYGFSVRCLRD